MEPDPSIDELADPLRLAVLESYGILDTSSEQEFDDLCKFAAQLCGTPMAVINFLDAERQWFKSEVGMGQRQRSLERAVCRHTLQQEALLVVPDLLLDPRFADRLPEGNGAAMRFYAGAVIRSREGVALGAVCVFDHQPRQLGELQTDALQTLARQVSALLDLRREARSTRRLATTRNGINVHLNGAAPLRETLQGCTQALVDYLQGAFARIWTLDTAEQVLVLQASAGCYTHLDGPHGRVPVGEFKIGRIARDQQPLLTNDVWHDPNIGDPAWARRENMLAFAGYPLLIDGRTVGVLAVFWRQVVAATLLEDMAPIAHTIAQYIERKTAEAVLFQTAEQRRLALDSARLGWWNFDLATGSLYWDERFKEIFGVKDGELVYEQVLALLHPDDREKMDAAIKAAIRPDDPVPYDIEYRVMQDDGSLRWVQAHGKAHFVEEGEARRAVSIVGTVMDVSEARAAQEALRANEEKYRSLFTSIDTGFCVIEMIWDDQGNATDYRFVEMNPAFVAHSGLQGAVGKTIREMFPGFEQVFIDRYARVARTGEAIRFEEGSEAMGKWFEAYAFALHQENQDQIAVLFSDNSERRRNELALQAAKNEAERNSQMKDEFLATLSHELRTPLNAVLGWTQVLRGDPSNTEDMEAGLATIERNARAQNQIIEDLLDMSKIVAGKVRLDVQPLELDQVIKSAVETMRPAADAKSIRLQALIDPEARMISGDPNRLQQVFWNLLTNALKFTPKGGRVQVVLERVNSHLEVSVTDSGEGIAPEFLPYVFDRFRQQDASTTRVHGGLGLGLAIVKQLVELHGGSVRAESAGRGMGTTFRVLLPLWVVRPGTDEVQGERVHPAASKGTPLVLPANGLCLEGVKALVVDDEADARGLVKRILEDRGARVQVAASVPEALGLLSAARVDVLVSDVGMPGQDGYELIRQVRALPPEQGGNTPAVALTAYARSEDRLKVILAGFQMHMAKPVEAAELLAQVASLTGRVNRP